MEWQIRNNSTSSRSIELYTFFQDAAGNKFLDATKALPAPRPNALICPTYIDMEFLAAT
jgi:hypothetical protein